VSDAFRAWALLFFVGVIAVLLSACREQNAPRAICEKQGGQYVMTLGSVGCQLKGQSGDVECDPPKGTCFYGAEKVTR